MSENTTNIEELKKNGFKNFTWGFIIEHYEIGPYNIVKYEPRTKDKEGYELSFHGWVGGRSTGHSWNTLDRAILGVIAYKADGHGTKADVYMANMVDLPLEEPELAIARLHA